MTHPQFRFGLAGLLLLALVLPIPAQGEPAKSSSILRPSRPGSREAAQYDRRLRFVEPRLGGMFSPSKSGLLLPDRRLEIYNKKDFTDRARWAGTRRAVFHHLKQSGARMSPAPYQKLLKKIRGRAEHVMHREGKGLGKWKMIVIEGGKADQVNAAAWTGGVITIFRPLVDLCFQIANVKVNSVSSTQLDKDLWKLSRWRQDKRHHSAPDTLRVSRDKVAARDVIAESILSRVVLHEMGHAASGHVALKDRELIIPGRHKPKDLVKSLAMEREADSFATTLGGKGAVRIPGAMPLFSYYNFISRPNFDARGKHAIANWRTHPLDAERYNSQLEVLSKSKRVRGLPQSLGKRIILPNGKYATPTKPAQVTPIRPKPVKVQQPLQQAAALPWL